MKKFIALVLLHGVAVATQAASFTINGTSYSGDCISSQADQDGVVALQCIGRPGATATSTSAPVVTQTSAAGAMRGVRVVDAGGAVWTFAADRQTLRNGVSAGLGAGSEYLVLNGTLYVYGTDRRWYRWAGQWVLHSVSEPT